ncbi:sulfatase [Nocardioides ginsengisoli]|uniref:Sulfatase-like hydrolase/transferase n=1 Tax=Nocardioides ginsengisoli TaxID=363868 RepID=A0ABW3VYR2_9ACTN
MRASVGRSGAVALAVVVALVVALVVLRSGDDSHPQTRPQPGTTPGGGPGQAAPQSTPEPKATAQLPKQPNIVVVMADDMRVDDLAFAPNVRRIIARHGVTFENSFSPYPLCCPARASFLTGEYAHNHKVFWHTPPYGYGAFDDSRTLATSLSAAGYRTGFVGKYLNRYGVALSKVSGEPSYRFVPPGWTDWRAAVENPGNAGFHGQTYDYFDTPFNVNGTIDNRYRGIYQSKVIGDFSVAMARRFAAQRDPFFMYVNYVAPHHGGPAEPDDPRPTRSVRGRWGSLPTPARPDWAKGWFDKVIDRGAGVARTGQPLELNRRDKPRPVQRRTQDLNVPDQLDALRTVTRQRAEAVMVMDRNIARLVRELKRSGAWDDTVLMFTSDNGMIIGEHGFQLTKVWAYEPSLRVPLLMTGPGLRTEQKRYDPISTVDLSATILDMADAQPPRTADGISRVPTLEQGDQGWATPIVSEAMNTSPGDDPDFTDVRTTIGLRVSRYSYTRFRNGGGELYDLVTDPREDHNKYWDRSYRKIRAALDELWLKVKDCKGEQCRMPLPDVLAASPTSNREATDAYWTAIRAAYGWDRP